MGRYREMEIFEAVAQAGSLAAAARHLELSPATIMRTVAALETRLGSRLLLRSSRGVRLSPAGEAFATSCQLILQEVAAAERSAAGVHTRPAGQLSVSLPLLMTHQVFMPTALAYLAAFPNVHLLTHTREHTPKLLEEGIDVAVVVGHLPDSSGFAVPVGNVRPIICASPEYLAKWGRPRTPGDLQAHRTITTSGQAQEWRVRCEHSGRLVKPAPVLTCSTPQAAIRAAVAGLGLTRCMSHEAHHELRSGLLEAVLKDSAGPALPVQLLYLEGRKAAARIRTFIDFAVPLLRAHPALNG